MGKNMSATVGQQYTVGRSKKVWTCHDVTKPGGVVLKATTGGRPAYVTVKFQDLPKLTPAPSSK